MNKIGILTSGGDAPGMNAAVYAAVQQAKSHGMTIIGIEDGYRGLLEMRTQDLTHRDLRAVMNMGGTFLGTARCQEMMTEEGRAKAVENIQKLGLEGLLVVGGDGSFHGAEILSNRGVPTVGMPGTIDNDLAYSDYTLGFDTACNTALDAVLRIRETMASHDRLAVVEVMGRHCGDIALYVALATGAEYVLVPEIEYSETYDLNNVVAHLHQMKEEGRDSGIIILAEGVNWENKDRAEHLQGLLSQQTGMDVRATVLGHIQRGGRPSMFDMKLAVTMATHAVTLLCNSIGNRVVGIKDDKIFDMDIVEALAMPRRFDENLYKTVQAMTH
jgi:6-phosphofructokinase 1